VGHTVYTTRQSTSARVEWGATWNISYGDQSGAAGVVVYDKVVIGAVTATRQAVEIATSVSSVFSDDTDDDGIVGLASSRINQVSPRKVTTFFDTVKSTLPLPLFTARKTPAVATINFFIPVRGANSFTKKTSNTMLQALMDSVL
jgi:aspergillopepsin I